MNPKNRRNKLSNCVPWDEFETRYASLFSSDTGNIGKQLRMTLGALIIQTKLQFSKRELMEQVTESPYLQYFIGLPGYQGEASFSASSLVHFRKRISAEMLMKANEYLLEHKVDDDNHHMTLPSGGNHNAHATDTSEGGQNKVMILL